MTRTLIEEQIATSISSAKCEHPLRVVIDGVDASGKTTLANELVEPLERLGRHVIRASIDGFYNPRAIRHQRGGESPEGYFFDSFDYEALKIYLLKPLGKDGNLQYQTSIFDFRTDSAIHSPTYHSRPDSILIFDGVFLLRSELVGCWDFTVFLDVDFDMAMERASHRDQPLFGSAENVKERYWKRYVPGQRIYIKTCQPKAYADIIVDNNDPIKPRVMRGAI
jgi:uridine kinase